MRKTREEKGITLIALIITIVVLLILAVVAINAVTGDGIIQHATNSKTEYEKAQAEENSILAYYEDYLKTQGNAGTWRQEGNSLVNAEGIKIQIGDKVNYVPAGGKTYTSPADKTGIITVENQTFTVPQTNDMEWYVIGEENGKIKLISSKMILPDGQQGVYLLRGKIGYNNCVEELNKIASIYGKGVGAESARSLNLGDIEILASITEAKKKELDSDYGSKIKFEYNTSTGTVWYSKNGGESVNTEEKTLYFIDEIIGVVDESNNIINTGPKEIIETQYSVTFSELNIDEQILNIILNGGIGYLATRINYTYFGAKQNDAYSGLTRYGLYISGYSNTGLNQKNLYNSNQLESQITNYNPGVRPVVILEKNIQLTYDSTNEIWKLSK